MSRTRDAKTGRFVKAKPKPPPVDPALVKELCQGPVLQRYTWTPNMWTLELSANWRDVVPDDPAQD